MVNHIGSLFGLNAYPLEHGEEYVFAAPEVPANQAMNQAHDPHGLVKAIYLEVFHSFDHISHTNSTVFP